MSRIALKIILEKDLPSDAIVIKQQLQTSIIGPHEESALICGNCSRTLIHGFSLDQFHNETPMGQSSSKKYVILQCPKCNMFNDTSK